MATDIKVGDQVELNQGSFTMIVTSIRGTDAECVWHDKNGKPYREWYAFATLKVYNPEHDSR